MSVATAQPTGSVPRHALRRGTRGFAAVVLLLTSLTILSIALFVLPASAMDSRTLTVLIPSALAFGMGHVVASYGLIRRRPWVVALTLYQVAIGLGVGVFVGLLVGTGVDPFLPSGTSPSVQGRLDTLSLVVWLGGSWIVAARFVVRGMAAPLEGVVAGVVSQVDSAPARRGVRATSLVGARG